jgi:hypothetical protein
LPDSSAASSTVDLTEDTPQFLQAGENAYGLYYIFLYSLQIRNQILTCRLNNADEFHHSSPAANKTSPFWQFYLLYHPIKHSDMKHLAKCRVIGCARNVDFSKGSTGLRTHIKHKQESLYRELNNSSKSSASESTAAPSVLPKVKSQPTITSHYHRDLTLEQRKQCYRGRLAVWTILECMPFTACESASFRAMIECLNVDGDKICMRGNHIAVRDLVLQFGEMAKMATQLEIQKYKGAMTSDHWKPKYGTSTFTCSTFHLINEHWKLVTILEDFCIFEGSTSGQRIFDYMKKKMQLSRESPNVFYAVVDTTGNMGRLTQLLREAGIKAAYCTEHSLH